MGWGSNPVEERAAQVAAAEAAERLNNRPTTPFERNMLAALNRIGAALDAMRPVLDWDGPREGTSKVADLLDADPADLGLAIDAGATALANQVPALRDDFTRAGLEKFAEIVIDAALKQAARNSEGMATALGEGGGGASGAPASTSEK